MAGVLPAVTIKAWQVHGPTPRTAPDSGEVREDAATVVGHLRAAVTLVVHHDELTSGPSVVDTPRRVEGTAEVKPPVNEVARYGGQPARVGHDFVRLQPRVVAPTVRYLPSDTETKRCVVVAGVGSRRRGRRDVRLLPPTPRSRCSGVHGRVDTHEQGVVSVDQSKVPQAGGNMLPKSLPLFRKEAPDLDGQPIDVFGCAGADSSQYDGCHALGMALGVGDPEDRSPGDAKNYPLVNLEMLSKALDVGDVVSHVDCRPLDGLFAGVWSAAARCALVEQNGSMPASIEVVTGPSCRS